MVKKLTPADILIRMAFFLIALYVLFPFFLVVINVFRSANDIIGESCKHNRNEFYETDEKSYICSQQQ